MIVAEEVNGAFTLKQPKSMGAVYALFQEHSNKTTLTNATSSAGASD